MNAVVHSSLIASDRLIWQNCVRHAATIPDREAIIHWNADEAPVRWTWRELMSTATDFGWKLREHGVGPGDVCGLIIRHNPFFYPIYLGACMLGAVPAVLAYPNPRLHPDKFRHGLEGMAQRSGLKWVLTERSLEEVLAPLVFKEGSSVEHVLYPLEWSISGDSSAVPSFTSFTLPEEWRNGTSPQDACLLQHSSGTTGLQKAVVLSHTAVLEHVSRYGNAIEIQPDDKVASWLPLYHDMGLICALHLPLAWGITQVQIDPFEWVMAPVLLLQAISAEKASLVWLPNFAYNLMADRVHEEDLDPVRLDSVRMFINCSERIRWESHNKFFKRFGARGLRPEVLSTAYAMAETTFAVTQTAPGVEPPTLCADRPSLAQGIYKPADPETGDVKRCVSSGKLISGCMAKIIGENGAELPDGRVGEIAIQSISMFDGYRNNPEATNNALRGGWYYSGDLGFRIEEEFYVIGRMKDVIIVAGKNIYPEDIEDAVSNVPGVLPGRVVAFGMYDSDMGTEEVCVIAETETTEGQSLKKLRLDIIQAGMGIDVTISRVHLVPPRWLIKSSSGKPSRKANKQRVSEGAD